MGDINSNGCNGGGVDSSGGIGGNSYGTGSNGAHFNCSGVILCN